MKITNTNLEYGHQEVLRECILETTSLGLADCCPIGTEDMKGRYVMHVLCLTSVYEKWLRKREIIEILQL